MSSDNLLEEDTATSHVEVAPLPGQASRASHTESTRRTTDLDPGRGQEPTRTLRPGVRSSTALAALRGVDDPVQFARTLQAWKQSVTERDKLPRYRVVGRLGQGAQGIVFGVADRDCLRQVALKTLNPHSRAKDDISRFIHEAQITAQLEHPGIVPVHDLDVLPDGTVFYTMKKVEGHTLADLIGDAHATDPVLPASLVRPTVHELLQIMLKICDTMAFAHSRNVIHRDLKPRNIMIGRYGEVLVMDWGLAKILDGQLDSLEQKQQVQSLRSVHDEETDDIHQTMIGAAVGTPAYMSPEQAKGQAAERRSDVYSLGVMLYRCVVGESPYDQGRIRYTLEQAVRGTWTRLDHRPAGRRLPKRLVAIVHTCMALDPLERYPSVDALAADLRSFLAGGAVSAYRETLLDRSGRALYEHRRAVAGMGVMVVLLGCAWSVLRWQNDRDQVRQFEMLRRSAVQHQLMGELEEARHDLERLLDQQPDDRDAKERLQRIRQALVQRADEVLTQRRRQDAMQLASAAAKLAEAGDDASLRLAQEAYLGALGLTPGDPSIRAAYSATVNLISQREAVEAVQRQASDRIKRADELHARAIQAQDNSDLRTAISALEAALMLHPTDERTKLHTALVARQVMLERISEVRTRQAEASHWILEARSAVQRQDVPTARDSLERAQQADADHPELPALKEMVQALVHAAATNEVNILLAHADEQMREVRILNGRMEEADAAHVSNLRQRRAFVLGLGLSDMRRAEQLAPWMKEPRLRLTRFYLDRLDEAEMHQDLDLMAERLVEARATDDGTQAAALAGLATVMVERNSPPVTLRRLGVDERIVVDSGTAVAVPIGSWIIGDVTRRLRRGELLHYARPRSELPPGCVYVPGGTREIAGEIVTVAGCILAKDTVDPEELALFHRLRSDAQPNEESLVMVHAFSAWKSARDGISWRLQTVGERRLAGFHYPVPELAVLTQSELCSLVDATHVKRTVEPSAVLRLAVE